MKFLWGSSKLNSPHGDFDGGAVAADGTQEKELNLAITLKIRDILVAKNISVALTREGDVAIEQTEATVRNKKRADLYFRRDFIEKSAKNGAKIFVSIHMNKFPEDASVSGAQVFYSKNTPASQVFAKSVQTALNAIENIKQREIKQATDDIFLLKAPSIPSVLVECGFLSNPQELQKLKSEEYQQQLAEIIAAQIITFLGTSQGNQT